MDKRLLQFDKLLAYETVACRALTEVDLQEFAKRIAAAAARWNPGFDLHSRTASLLFQMPETLVTEEQLKTARMMNRALMLANIFGFDEVQKLLSKNLRLPRTRAEQEDAACV